MNLTLKVWRQENKDTSGEIETYVVSDIPEEASFLEMLDIVNNQIIENGGDPITFDHDCSCLLYTSPSPRDISGSRMPSSA